MKAIRFTAAALAVSLCIALLCPAALADEGDVTVKLNQKSVSLAVGDTVQLSADVSDGKGIESVRGAGAGGASDVACRSGGT